MKIVKVARPKKFHGSPPKPKTRKRKPQHFNLAAKEAFAAQLREKPTNSEALMCELLDKLNIEYEFQPVVCGYIPDFLFPEKRKILELDGHCHRNRKAYDQKRDAILKRGGYKVRRVPSSLIFKNVDRLIEIVKEFLGMLPKERTALPKRTKLQGPDELREQFYFATQGI